MAAFHTRSGANPCGRAALMVAAAFALGACAGSGEGLDDNGRPPGENPGTSPPGGAVTFAMLQNTIFTPLCTACHAGGAAPLGLRLEAGVSYAMLVNIASVEVPALVRVSPGDPDSSYLVHKIEGRAAVGARMPLGGPPLGQTMIDDVRQWISQGAPPPVISLEHAMPTPVVATAPIDGEEVSAGLHRVLVVFARELDASLLNATTVTLNRIGGTDPHARDATRVVSLAAIHVPAADPVSVWIETAVPLGPGEYELQLRASGAAGLADSAGNLLDGDADGVAGGDYRMTFSVTQTAR